MSIAIDAIRLSFIRTKKLVLPFAFKKWFWLAVIVLLGSSSGGGGGLNFRSSGIGDMPAFDFVQITEWLPILIGIGVLLILVGLALAYIRSIFLFVMFDTAWRSRTTIRRSFNEYHGEGIAVFKYKLLLLLVSLVPIGCGLGAWALWSTSIPLSIAVGLIGGVCFVGIILFNWLVHVISLPLMYHHRQDLLSVVRAGFQLLKRRTGDILLFLVMQFVLGIATGLAVVVLAAGLLIVVGLIVLVIGGLGWLLYSLAGGLAIPLIVLGVLVGLPLALATILAMFFIVMPFAFFHASYLLEFSKKLAKKL